MEFDIIKIIKAQLPPCPEKSNSKLIILAILLSLYCKSPFEIIFFLACLYFKSFCMLHIVFYILTISQSATSVLILNLSLHVESTRPAYQFLIMQGAKLVFTGIDFASAKVLLVLLVSLMIISKDSRNLFLVRNIYQDSYLTKHEISDNLEFPVLFIHENGSIAKSNKKAANLFQIHGQCNLFDLIPAEKIDRFKQMIKVSIQKKIPEEDSTYIFYPAGKMNYWVSMKMVPFEDLNCFLITFENANLSRKKREQVLDSYRKNFLFQNMLSEIFINKYINNQKVRLEDCCQLIKYIYCQQETINITEMVTGQVIVQPSIFNFEEEIINCINLYWDVFEQENISISLHIQKPLIQIYLDKIKHHLLIKSIILIIKHIAEPNTKFDFHLNQVLSQFDSDLFYTFLFTSKSETLSDFTEIMDSYNNVDKINNIMRKYDTTVSLFPWLLELLGGFVHNLQVTDHKVTLSLNLRVKRGNSFDFRRPYLFAMKTEKSILNWIPYESSLDTLPSQYLKSRQRASAETEVITEVITEEINDSWSDDYRISEEIK